MIPLVVASLVLSGQALSADDPVRPPGRPADLRVVVNPGALECDATWTALPRATRYRLRWRLPGTGFLPGNELAVEHPGAAFTLPEYGRWVVRLEGCNTAGCGPGIARSVATMPAAAAGLAVGFTPGTLRLSATWVATTGASWYRLRWRRIGGGFLPGNQVAATSNSREFTVSASGRWVVRVEGCNAAGCGSGFVRTVDIAPPRPQNLTLTPSGDLRLTATWDALPGVSSYKLRWRRFNSGFAAANQLIVTSPGAGFTVPESGKWVVRVEACDAAGCGRGASAFVVVAAPPRMPAVSVCDRTPAVRRALVRETGKPCHEITAADLATVYELPLDQQHIRSLKTGDFDGLSSLESLSLWDNDLTALPAGNSDGLSRLRDLGLSNNALTSLPAGVFDDLTGLEILFLYGNALRALPAGVFDDLSNLELLELRVNALTALPAGVFDGLSRLRSLALSGNPLTSLSADVFDGLSGLQELHLVSVRLASLPAGVFDGLSALLSLYLDYNDLTELPAGAFDGLSGLRTLALRANALGWLSADAFDGLSGLKSLHLADNDLTELPDGVFDDLVSLLQLDLTGNPGTFTVDLGPDVMVRQ